MSDLGANWSGSQRAVLTEMKLPLYRLRGVGPVEETEAEHPIVAEAVAIDAIDVGRTRWFGQLRAFAAGIDIDLRTTENGVELQLGNQPRLSLSTLLPEVDQKRALYRAAKAALRSRQ